MEDLLLKKKKTKISAGDLLWENRLETDKKTTSGQSCLCIRKLSRAMMSLNPMRLFALQEEISDHEKKSELPYHLRGLRHQSLEGRGGAYSIGMQERTAINFTMWSLPGRHVNGT